ncbi:unnamed protein product [Adineta steineri]|uniref:Prolyl 4-hydroxylase alpha subunit domain-containing protein n=1 Tax=Adineta steineri TaxID=433720 RepID=A0A815GRD8_9BILA|nr:unnamed protein product [Adineta steineri]CAF4001855.1 unnamed protein product [Adineta steineri]
MNSNIQIRNLLTDTDLVCFVVCSLFTKEECEQLLNCERKNSFQKAISNYPTYYRNNERLVIDDPKLSSYLFEKVKPYLPNQIETKSENEIWTLTELNNRLRFCKYNSNQYFHRHLDGIHYVSKRKQSKLTFMIYLNNANEFEGGRTLFYKSKDSTDIWASYISQQGDLMIFDHNLWHEGEEVKNGEKFLLRSDILYTKDSDDDIKGIFCGHLGYIWKILMFDNETLLSAGRDKTIHVWNINGDIGQILTEHRNSILCMEKLNETTFLSGSRDKQIKVWQRNENQIFQLVNSFSIHTATVLSLCKLTNDLFASSGADNSIKIVNINGQIEHELIEHTNWVWQVIKLTDYFIASCSEDNTIKIWDYQNEKCIKTFTEHCPIICLTYDNITNTLISGDFNGEIVFRELSDDFNEISSRKIIGHNGIVRIILKLNEKLLASGGEDNKIKIWNIQNGSCIKEFQHENFVQSLVFTNDYKLLSASYDGTIKIWTI